MGEAGHHDALDEPHWRSPAPAARAGAMALFGWRNAPTASLVALVAALPAILAALAAPALLTFSQTADLLAPIAEARALAAGATPLSAASSPFDLALFFAADFFFEAPGRIHLGAKAIAALLAAAMVGTFAVVRFSLLQSAMLAAVTAAFVAAPFSGNAESALALLTAVTIAFLCAPADDTRARAFVEGALAGVVLLALWMSNAVLALAGVAALSACPFLSGRHGFVRYAGAMLAGGLLAGGLELLSPGLSAARADTVTMALASMGRAAALAPPFDSAALGLGAVVVLMIGAIFGGQGHRRNWMTALAFLLIGWAAARLVGADPAILFVVTAAIAVFSTTSPFYDGVFRDADRASIAVAGAAGFLSLAIGASLVLQSADQFMRQTRAAANAPAETIRAFAIVQPPGPAIARWVRQGRFATPEARALFPLTPADQSAMLLAAGARARALDAAGYEVAILAGADIACVIAGRRDCSTDGKAAAARAKIVLVPRADIDAAGALTRDRSEALLYTEFRKVEETPQWDIWVRRGITLPDAFVTAL